MLKCCSTFSTSPSCPSESEEKVEIPNQYNASDRKAIRENSVFIHGLVSVARGMDDVNYFKQLMRHEKLDVRKELESLGFDLSKDFIVNGKKFAFKNGELTLVSTA